MCLEDFDMKRIDKTKLQKLLDKLKAGNAVSLRDIELNLGVDGLDRYNSLWAKELERRNYFKVKPKLIKDYDELVKKADFANNKLQPNTKHPKPTKLYEITIELHKQILDIDITQAQWFDRAVSEVTADVNGIARLVTSRSELKHTSGNAEAVSKEAIKRIVLNDAISKIEAKEKAFSESEIGIKQKLILKQKLADLISKSNKW